MGNSVGEWNQDLRCIEVDLTDTSQVQAVVTVALPGKRRVVVALTRVIRSETRPPYEVPLAEWGNCLPSERAFVAVLPGGTDALYRIRATRYEGPCTSPGSPENDTSTPTGLIEQTQRTIAQWIWHFGTPLEKENALVSLMNLDDLLG